MRKILVTGGAGFIGSSLASRLVSNEVLVIAYDNLDPYYNPQFKKANIKHMVKKRNFVFVKDDIRNKKGLMDVFDKYKPQYIVHLAAKVGVRNSIKYPQKYFEVNVIGTINLLEAVKNRKIKNFILASSSSVYGTNKKLPFSENDETNNQLSPYAVSKRSAELLCGQYASLYSLPITVLRLFTVYGPRQRPDLAIPKFIRNMKTGKELRIYGDGNVARDFIYIDDVISGMVKAINNPFKFEIFNLGSTNPVTINTLVAYLEKILGKKAKNRYFPFRKEDMRITYANIGKAKKLLDWKPTVDIKEGLSKTLESLNY